MNTRSYQQTNNRPAKMGVMADISQTRFHSIKGIENKADCIKPCRDAKRQEEHPDVPSRKKHHIGENDAANASRCAVGLIYVMPVDVEGKQIASDNRTKIDHQKL